MNFFDKKIFLKNIFITYLLSLTLFPFYLESSIKNSTKKYGFDMTNFVKDSEYILGPGDKLFIRFFGATDFSGEVNILNDGSVSIPIIGDIYITGITKKMAEEKIERLLTPHLIQKDVQVLVINPRKIKFVVKGEVNNPGIYSINEKESFNAKRKEFPFLPATIKSVPTLIDAIQKSGGLTNKADITKIEIKRRMPSNKNLSNHKLAYSNLLKLLKQGDFDQNPSIFDGDLITVAKIPNIENKSLLDMGNLTPGEIDVFVVGEVKSPGLMQISNKSTISEAILAAGGPINFRSKKNKIKVLRNNKSGHSIIEESKFSLKNNLKKNNKIILKNGDIIFVDSSGLAKTNDAISAATLPFVGLYRTLQFIRLINGEESL